MGNRRLAPFSAEFTALFATFQYTAYRLETLQRYTVPYEEEPFRRFLAGQPPPEDPDKEQWLRLIRDATQRDRKRMQRVHVVVEPPTDYIRYELAWEYSDNVVAGEDVRILTAQPGQWPVDLPRHDYLLFDSRWLCRMDYDEQGRLLGADLIEDPAEVVRHNWWRDVALHQAVPYSDYMRGHQEFRQVS